MHEEVDFAGEAKRAKTRFLTGTPTTVFLGPLAAGNVGLGSE